MSDDGSHERLYNPDKWGCVKDISVLGLILAVMGISALALVDVVTGGNIL